MFKFALINLLTFACTLSAYSFSTCSSITSCTHSTVANGCTIELHWIQCDGSHATRTTGCFNTGCRRNCTCECESDGYAVSFCICPDDMPVTNSFVCSGC